jgi:HK97 family phage major capsid protein
MELREFKDTLTEWQGAIQKQVTDLLKVSGDNAETARKVLETELDTVKKALNSVNEQMKTLNVRHVPGLDKKEASKFDFGMVVKALYLEATGQADPWKEAGLEKEMSMESMKLRDKANDTTTGASGGFLISDEVSTSFIDMVMQGMPLQELGMNIVKGLVGELPVPKKTSRTQGYMVGENGKPAESAVQYGEVILRPKKGAAFSKQSNRLIYQSRGVSDKIVKDDLMYVMQRLLTTQALGGVGSGKQVKGLYQFSGDMTTSSVALAATGTGLATGGGRFKIDDAGLMIDDIECVDEDKTPGAKMGFLMHPRVKNGMKRERVQFYSGQAASSGMPILPMNLLMNDKVLSDQIGQKIATTTLVPNNETLGSSSTCSSVMYGNWDLFWMGMWRDLIIKVSDVAGDGSTGSAFLDDQLYIVIFQEFDTALMRPAAFTRAVGAETTKANW